MIEADFSSFAGHAHPVDLHNSHRVIGAVKVEEAMEIEKNIAKGASN